MPKSAAAPSSIRRSSRSPVPPSSSSDSRSPDATAYQLLANQLEKEEWRQLSNRKGGFALVKKGHSIDDAVEGESMLIEEGFTLQKYEELFFDTMEEEELEEWTDRLPDHPKLPAKSIKSKKGNRVSISPSDASSSEDEEEEYELIGGERSRAASSKKKGVAKKSTNKKSTQGKKKRKRSTEDDLDSDGEDGMPGGSLRRFQKELFDTWLTGKAEFDSFNKKKQSIPKSFKAMKSAVAETRDVFVNEHENDKMIQFKKEKMDPIARKAKAAIKEYVQAQAAELEKDLIDEMLLDNHPLSDEEGGEEEEENAAEGGGEEETKEIMEDDKVDNEGAADKAEGGKSVNADWTSAVIEGSNSNEST